MIYFAPSQGRPSWRRRRRRRRPLPSSAHPVAKSFNLPRARLHKHLQRGMQPQPAAAAAVQGQRMSGRKRQETGVIHAEQSRVNSE